MDFFRFVIMHVSQSFFMLFYFPTMKNLPPKGHRYIIIHDMYQAFPYFRVRPTKYVVEP